MKGTSFLNQETDPPLFYRKVSQDGKIEIGVHPVLFGFRILAGYVGNDIYELNYCAGGSIKEIEKIYSIVLTILSNRSEFHFDGFPRQIVKPMYNDTICENALIKMMSGLDPIKVSTPHVHIKKNQYLTALFNDHE